MQSVLIVGAGAIGGFLGGLLARAGHRVAVVARGEHARALENSGLRLEGNDGSSAQYQVKVYQEIDHAEPADLLFVTLKAHQVHGLVDAIARLARAASVVVPVHNGVGWWYFQRGGPAEFRGRPVRSVDPDGRIAGALPVDRVVPMFAFKSAEVTSPGVVRHIVTASDKLTLGALDPGDGDLALGLVEILTRSGINCSATDVRQTMWTKLMGNIFANPLCALTGLDLSTMTAHPEGRAMSLELMKECAAVAGALGVTMAESFDDRLERGRSVGRARPSMLQDRLAGRPMEIDAILGGLIELGELCGIDTVRARTLAACLRLLESTRPSTAHSTPERSSPSAPRVSPPSGELVR
ncbi:MAG: hypothetical protein RL322_2416 [Pseudomonadota bacterium]|jgi:2-dehydropantoate 2-reductase